MNIEVRPHIVRLLAVPGINSRGGISGPLSWGGGSGRDGRHLRTGVYILGMSSPSSSLVYVVVENPSSEECRVKAVFESEEAAREAIEQEFPDFAEYEVVPRTLYESITE